MLTSQRIHLLYENGCKNRDTYGRILAYVVRDADKKLMNEELIPNGCSCAD